jgi:hypothetical protein
MDEVNTTRVGLGLAGHHCREMEDDVGTGGDELLGLARHGKIGGEGFRARWRGRRHDVVQDELTPAAVAYQPLGQLAADHAGRADDEGAFYQSGSQSRHQGASFFMPPLR